MENDWITRERRDAHPDSAGRDYLWFALLLLIVLAGVAGG
jgi:hypothetical protein